MKTVRTIAELRQRLDEPRRGGHSIGLVPTMGSFHDGHLSLIGRAREECDVLVVSLFVNPAQFDQPDDLRRYPRDETRDARLAAEAGVDYLFAPPVEEMYPPGFASTVSVGGITATLEGAYRGRAHFDGVATVVTKLLNIVGPGVAYFGQKDAQQALVIKRFVRDLDIPVRIEVCPTVREPDGLAMSSRNALLSPEEHARALAISRALRSAQEAVAAGERDAAKVAGQARAQMACGGVEPEYLELVSTDTLAPVGEIGDDVLVVVAAQVGDARLIDNEIIHTSVDREVATLLG
ncbi:MAG TPA: pantoate--beta-alanine ligase [Solirubrobacteraceae bacterium]|jgi:pantoate--beta-alanine ligase|nr:pantoate--beta-alanine ligase [Solirubrobacteraceae bacterium]